MNNHPIRKASRSHFDNHMIDHRILMKPRLLLPLLLVLLATPAILVSQGPLTPPGAPEPTMKTLNQIDAKLEKRTPITSLPTTITEPGSWYLAESLFAEPDAVNGITIAADNVSLDLNGFTLTGAPDTLSGIAVTGVRANISIRNGTVSGWGRYGIHGDSADNSSIHRVLAQGNGVGATSWHGLSIGLSGRIIECSAFENGGNGIEAKAGSVVNQCAAGKNGRNGISGGDSCVISACSAFDNSAHGVDCSQGQTSEAATITNCSAESNGASGIFAGPGCVIANCTVTGNVADGIFGESGSLIHHCVSRLNTGDGIDVAIFASVLDCTCAFNTLDGIRATSSCRIIQNNASNNGNAGGDGAGIHTTGDGNRIEANHVYLNDRGIDVDAAGNVIIRNSASRNSFEYTIAASNGAGPIVTTGNVATNNSPNANFDH
jgi:parallel beta-helix repeat protein